MTEITFETIRQINVELLNHELNATVPELVSGISTGPYGIRLHLSRTPTAQERSQLQEVVATHDPTRLTPEQQAEQQRQQKLIEARTANRVPIDPAIAEGQDAVTKLLIQKIAWLELEIQDPHRV